MHTVRSGHKSSIIWCVVYTLTICILEPILYRFGSVWISCELDETKQKEKKSSCAVTWCLSLSHSASRGTTPSSSSSLLSVWRHRHILLWQFNSPGHNNVGVGRMSCMPFFIIYFYVCEYSFGVCLCVVRDHIVGTFDFLLLIIING